MWNILTSPFVASWRLLVLLAKVLCSVFIVVALAAVLVLAVEQWTMYSNPLPVLIGIGVVVVFVLMDKYEHRPLWKLAAGGINSAIPGQYIGWPLPTLIVLLVLGLIPAIGHSEGQPLLFAVGAATNPVLWLVMYPLWHLGRMRCPHCRKSASVSEVGGASVGSPLACPCCNNVVSKPAG